MLARGSHAKQGSDSYKKQYSASPDREIESKTKKIK